MGKLNVIVEPGKQEMSYTRTFDAQRELVFKIYNDPNLIPQWWGPAYLTTVVDKMEVRPGGIWRHVQTAPDGGQHAFFGVYHSIVPNERIVSTFEYEGTPGKVSLDTVEFREENSKTTLYGQSVFQSLADMQGMVEAGAESGMIEMMDRLEVLLEKVRV